MPLWLEPCDLIFTANPTGRFGRLIRWRTRAPVNHVAGVTRPGTLYTAEILEALHPRAKRWPLGEAYAGEPDLVEIYRPLNLTLGDREAIVRFALEYEGRKYGWGKIALHAFGVPEWAGVERWPICSWIWAQAYFRRGYTFGATRADQADPARMRAFVHDTLGDRYACLRELAPVPALEAA